MRGVYLLLPLLLVPSAACHRKPAKNQSGLDEFTTPAPPGQEEKWVEPEPEDTPKPTPPPPPPEPTSAPPTDGLGFTLGHSKNDTMRKCSKRGTWGKRGESYTCSRGVDGAAIDGKPVLSFCGDSLCAVGVAVAGVGAVGDKVAGVGAVGDKVAGGAAVRSTSSGNVPTVASEGDEEYQRQPATIAITLKAIIAISHQRLEPCGG